MRRNEDLILEDVKNYIVGTYGEHYGYEDQRDLLDTFEDMGIFEDFSKASAMKYIARYGKKDGHNKKDLFKAIHYCVLLLYLNHYGSPDNE